MALTKKTLLGKELIFTEEMDLFNSLRRKYLLLSTEAAEKAKEEFLTKITGYEEYRSYGQGIMDEIFERYLQIGVRDIISYGIYDIDEVVLCEEFEKDFGCAYKNAIGTFTAQINRIDAEQAAADEERKEMVQNAGPIEGSYVATTGNIGQDLGNIVGNAVETTAINAVFKGGTALLTSGIRALEKKGAEKERNAIFEDESTSAELVEGMEQDVYLLHRTIARLINERTEVEHFYYATEDMINRFEPVCRNILQGNFKDAEQKDLEKQQIHNVIMMNPYELRVYGYIMRENGGMTEELKDIMEYLCVDKMSLADSYLKAKYDLSDYTTYESMTDFEKVVLKEMEPFGVSGCSFYDAVATKKEALYVARRTFHGHTYDSIEERDLVEKQYDYFMEEEFEKMTLDELLEKYDTTYDKKWYEKNREEFQMFILQLIKSRSEEFQSSDEVLPYVTYAKQKKSEHQLETSELLTIFENKYKNLARKEKISAGVAVVKGKLVAAAAWVKRKGEGIATKLPRGKKLSGKKLLSKKTDGKKLLGKKTNKKFEQSEIKELPENPVPQIEQVQETQVQPEPPTKEEAHAKEEPEAAIEPKAEDAPATKECPQCGAIVKATGKFCTKCGYKF